MNVLKIFTQFEIPGSEIIIDLPSFGGFFSRGVFSAIGQGMYFFIAILVVVWIGFAIYGAFSIISSLGDPQKIEKGWKTIKSVWIGISYFLLFFVIITLAAVLVGVGAPWNWAENLQQCAQGGHAAGRFYFQGKSEIVAGEVVTKSYNELLDEFISANPASPGSSLTAYVVCCDNFNGDYIDIVRFESAVPANCSLNSSKQIRGTVPGGCKGGGISCSNDSECCSNVCADSGGGLRCAP